MHIGESLGSLLAVEYGFHVTLMIAGVILGAFILTLLRQRDMQQHDMLERDEIGKREMQERDVMEHSN
jgi:uncharacterized membrane protein (DUF106 family)